MARAIASGNVMASPMAVGAATRGGRTGGAAADGRCLDGTVDDGTRTAHAGSANKAKTIVPAQSPLGRRTPMAFPRIRRQITALAPQRAQDGSKGDEGRS
jgi:hypothetical protein